MPRRFHLHDSRADGGARLAAAGGRVSAHGLGIREASLISSSCAPARFSSSCHGSMWWSALRAALPHAERSCHDIHRFLDARDARLCGAGTAFSRIGPDPPIARIRACSAIGGSGRRSGSFDGTCFRSCLPTVWTQFLLTLPAFIITGSRSRSWDSASRSRRPPGAACSHRSSNIVSDLLSLDVCPAAIVLVRLPLQIVGDWLIVWRVHGVNGDRRTPFALPPLDDSDHR
jgi:hypothetical protein